MKPWLILCGLVLVLVASTATAGTFGYVATNGNDAAVGTNWATAWLTISNAVAQISDGDTVLVSNGTYDVTVMLSITNGITLQSFTGASNTTIRGSAIKYLSVNHPDAVVDGFLLTGGTSARHVDVISGALRNCIFTGNSANYNGGPIGVSGGLVSDCIFTNNFSWPINDGRAKGGAVIMSSGVISNCLFTGNTAYSGGAVYMTGGKIISCVITNNNSYNGAGVVAGGVLMTGGQLLNSLIANNQAGVRMNNGSMVNCTVADNTMMNGNPGAGLYMTGGVVTNSIIYYNGSYPATTTENIYVGGGSIVYSCAQPLPSGTGNTGYPPDFVDRTAGDYGLLFGSACIDSGTNLPWLTVDLNGSPRPVDGDLDSSADFDMGCYESATPDATFVCNFSGQPTFGTNSLQVVFTAVVAGSGTNTVTYVWDFDNDGNADLSGTQYRVVTNLYSLAGAYSVDLTCTNSLAVTTNITKPSYIAIVSTSAYVKTNGTPAWPYATWATAATNIQDAITSVSTPGTVYVTNGTYTIPGIVNLTKAVTLISANGPSNTTILGDSVKYLSVNHSDAVVDGFLLTGGTALRAVDVISGALRNCIFTGNSAAYNGAPIGVSGGLVSNCIFTNNYTSPFNDTRAKGGAVIMSSGVVSNCLFTGNSAYSGGAVYMTGGKIISCVITNNNSYNGAGVVAGGVLMTGGQLLNSLIANNQCGVRMNNGSMVNCTVADNTMMNGNPGAGLYMTGGVVTNSIIYYNGSYPATTTENIYVGGGSIVYSCAQPLQSGAGNTGYSPDFVDRTAGNFRLLFGSASIDSGTNLPWLTMDLDGNPRPVDGDLDSSADFDMGCYESAAPDATFVCNFSAQPTFGTNSLQVVFTAVVAGSGTNTVTYVWDFDNDGNADLSGTQYRVVTNLYSLAGAYSVDLTCTNSLAVTTNITKLSYIAIVSTSAYVKTNGTPTWPYATWATAATNIQDAITSVSTPGTVYVTNGTYTIPGIVNLTKAVTLVSANGPSNTTIRGDSVKYLSVNHSDAVVDGFLLTGGTSARAVDVISGVLRNCIFTGNSASYNGAPIGVSGGLVSDCIFTNNYTSPFYDTRAKGGAVIMTAGVVSNCLFTGNSAYSGGAVYMTGGKIISCVMTNNNSYNGAGVVAGGVHMTGGQLVNSLIANNQCGVWMNNGSMVNCTVAGNTMMNGNPGAGLYMTGGAVTNSIIYYNGSYPATTNENIYVGGGSIVYSCAQPLPAGTGNIGDLPVFDDRTAGNYRLKLESPCVNAATILPWMTGAFDLDGRERIISNFPEMGCYETPLFVGTVFIFR